MFDYPLALILNNAHRGLDNSQRLLISCATQAAIFPTVASRSL